MLQAFQARMGRQSWRSQSQLLLRKLAGILLALGRLPPRCLLAWEERLHCWMYEDCVVGVVAGPHELGMRRVLPGLSTMEANSSQ